MKMPLLFVIALLFSSCQLISTEKDQRSNDSRLISADSTFALVDVNVISMTQSEGVSRQTVIIDGGLISETGSPGDVQIPENAVRIEAKGRYLIPGLFDMHVHLTEDDLEQYVRHGVTSVRNMWGTPNVLLYKEQIESGERVGPSVYSASPGIEGSPPTWPLTRIIEKPSEAAGIVDGLKKEGWPFIKLYNKLEPDEYRAIVDAAEQQQIRILGHVPLPVPVEETLDRHASIEHLTGYDQRLGGKRGFHAWISIDENLIPELARQTGRSDTWNCPTLVVLDGLSEKHLSDGDRERAETNRFTFVRALYEEGARLLIGTDAGVHIIEAGTSIHGELKKFVQLGISPYETLRIATLGAAEFLGIDGKTGSIEPGKHADMVLLNADPLENIGHTRQVEGVFLKGAWIPAGYFGE